MTERLYLCVALVIFLLANASQADEPYGPVIRGGRVVDGTGAPWYVAAEPVNTFHDCNVTFTPSLFGRVPILYYRPNVRKADK